MFNCIRRFFTKYTPVLVPNGGDILEPIPTPEVGSSASNITIADVKGATTAELLTVGIAQRNIEVLNKSPEFKEEVLAFKFNQSLTNGLSNEAIFELYTKKIFTVKLAFFSGSFYQNHISKTEGYEPDENGYIRINRYFLTDAAGITSLIYHEIGHQCGMTHPNMEQDSVNYGMNFIVNRVLSRLALK